MKSLLIGVVEHENADGISFDLNHKAWTIRTDHDVADLLFMGMYFQYFTYQSTLFVSLYFELQEISSM